MDMGMESEFLTPSMQHGEEADFCAEVFRIASDVEWLLLRWRCGLVFTCRRHDPLQSQVGHHVPIVLIRVRRIDRGKNVSFAMSKLKNFTICMWLLILGAPSAKAQESRGFRDFRQLPVCSFQSGRRAVWRQLPRWFGSFGAYLTSRIGVIGEFGGCKVTG